MRETAEEIFGDGLADCVGPIGGWEGDEEIR